MTDFIFTSESVSEGHPDKVCDQISDAILDHYLKEDPHVRAGIEAVATTNRVILLGEVTSASPPTHDRLVEIVRAQVKKIGYQQEGFDWRKLEVDNYLNEQSRDIAQGIATNGAGDQGLMFGYACNDTEALMPAPLYYSHRLLQQLAQDRHQGNLPELGPDAKTQISLRYIDNQPIEATSIVLSTQHQPHVDNDAVMAVVRPYIERALPDDWITDSTRILINSTGRFVVGGPDGDSGMTGRKIVVDTYGGAAPHGGGAFSGKDPTKVDRSAAYMARYLAKNIVGAGLAERCTLQLSYAIGKAEPTSLYVNTHETGLVQDSRLSETLRQMLTLTPQHIRQTLGLNRPIYERTATYGHFGRTPDTDGGFSWERLDLVAPLRSEFL